ncbi:MAG: hypothetical protein JRI31_08130 [Deltaproteobacteria bacterium]|nr:hypothetical protein [Deltaproteobacteria bacterium]
MILLCLLMTCYCKIASADSVQLESIGVKIISKSKDYIEYSFKVKVRSLGKEGKVCVDVKGLDINDYEIESTLVCGVVQDDETAILTDTDFVKIDKAKKIRTWIAEMPDYSTRTVSTRSPSI